MFLHVSVSHSVHGGVYLSACWDTTPPRSRYPPRSRPPKKQAPPQKNRHTPTPQEQTSQEAGTPPRSRHTSQHGYCCGRYASYWNAFLFRVTSLLADSTSLNGALVCNASCDCSTENCRLMLLVNPGLKSSGWNVCEIKQISSVPESTTTTSAITTQTTVTTTTTTTTMIRPGSAYFFNSVKIFGNVYFIIHVA